MAVSAIGQNLNFDMVRRLAVGVVVIFAALTYLYGPAYSPTLHKAAASECNAYAEGNFRSFRLSWTVGVLPHWSCWDASRPQKDPVSLGWWTNPFS